MCHRMHACTLARAVRAHMCTACARTCAHVCAHLLASAYVHAYPHERGPHIPSPQSPPPLQAKQHTLEQTTPALGPADRTTPAVPSLRKTPDTALQISTSPLQSDREKPSKLTLKPGSIWTLQQRLWAEPGNLHSLQAVFTLVSGEQRVPTYCGNLPEAHFCVAKFHIEDSQSRRVSLAM